MLNRAQVFDLLQRGVIAHATYVFHIESMERHNDTVVVIGHGCIVAYFWLASGGSWRMVARHANAASPSVAAP